MTSPSFRAASWAFLFLSASLTASAAGDSRIVFRLVGDAAKPGAPTQALVRLIPEGAPPGVASPDPLAITVPGERIVPLAEPYTWRVELQQEGFWSPGGLIRPGATLEVLVFAAGALAGQLQAAQGVAVPASVSARFVPPVRPTGADAKPVVVSCPVEGGAFRCLLPAGRLDLRLKAGEFAPVYLWDLVVPAGKATEVGGLRLERGGSVVGYASMADGQPLSGGCRALLQPSTLGEPAEARVAEKLDMLQTSAPVSRRGFFQFQGVRAGRYHVTVSEPRGLTTRTAQVDVHQDLETEILDAFVLTGPLRFELFLEPVRDPRGSPWKIRLLSRGSERVGMASAEGYWSQPSLSPGTYDVMVEDQGGARYFHQRIELSPGQGPVRVDLPLVAVKGLVTSGGGPFPCALWFGGKAGSRRVRFESDRDGRFEGFLPGEGRWRVDLEPDGEGPRIAVDPVDVSRPEAGGVAEVEIHVPDTEVEGRVVDEDRQGVAGIPVVLTGLREEAAEAQVRTDDAGRFRLRGLAPGAGHAQAQDEQRASDLVPFAIEEGRKASGILLVVRPIARFTGRVRARTGPVPGARIYAWPPLSEQAPLTSISETVTGPDGAFEIPLPAFARLVDLAILAPGYAARFMRLSRDGTRPPEILVERDGGALVLKLAAGSASERRSGILYNGMFLLPGFLRRCARDLGGPPGGEELIVPNVEAGEYSLCVGSRAMSALLRGDQPSASACTGGFLPVHGELVLGPAEEAAGPTRHP